jgi:heme exporter protein B
VWADAWLVAWRDLRIELRSRVLVAQVVPIAALTLLLFAFALGPGRRPLQWGAPGLFWVAIALAAVLAAARVQSVDAAPGARDALRAAGLDASGEFLGRTAVVAAELVVLEAVLLVGLVVLYGSRISDLGALVVSGLIGAIGVAAATALLSALCAGIGTESTLLPLLALPVLAPVVIAGTRTWQVGLGGKDLSVSGGALLSSDPWGALLVGFAAAYLGLGTLVAEQLAEVR